LRVNPFQIATVKRGDSVYFNIPVRNQGYDPITIKPVNHSQGDIRFNDEYPITIKPHEERNLSVTLFTGDLYKFYKGRISFYSNEDRSEKAFNLKDYENLVYKQDDKISIQYEGQLIFENLPSITFDSFVLSKFISRGETCIFDFGFVHDGDVPLLIRYAKTSSSCLVASWPKEPILPSERANIGVKYDSKRVGPINKSITVLTNVSSRPIVLRVKRLVKMKM